MCEVATIQYFDLAHHPHGFYLLRSAPCGLTKAANSFAPFTFQCHEKYISLH